MCEAKLSPDSASEDTVRYAAQGRGGGRNGLSIASLVVGIIAIPAAITVIGGLVLGAAAILLQIVGNARARRQSQGTRRRGVVLGILAAMASIGAAGVHSCLREFSRQLYLGAARNTLKVSGVTLLQNYVDEHSGDYPPDLDALFDDRIGPGHWFQDNMGPTSNQITDLSYVVGLSTRDPPHWIVMFGDPARGGGDGALVVRVDGEVLWFDEPEFSETLKSFMHEYQARYGTDPTIIPPY